MWRSKLLILLAFCSLSYGDFSRQCFSEDGKPIISSEDCCKILCKHVKLFKTFEKLNKKRNIIDFHLPSGLPFIFENFDYKNLLIRICIENMSKKASLDPLFKLWDFAVSMELNKRDAVFLREFSIVIFTLYENILVMINAAKVDKIKSEVAIDEIISLYNTVSEMPIREIVIALEKCYRLFCEILNDYQFYSTLSWSQWLRNYWWVVPTITVAVITVLVGKTIMVAGTANFPYSQHMSPFLFLKQK